MTGMSFVNFGITAPSQNLTGMQLLGSTTLTVAATSITVTFTARKILQIFLYSGGKDVADTVNMRFNGDATGKYSYRTSNNGGAETTANTQNQIVVDPNSTSGPTSINVVTTAPGVQTRSVALTTSGGDFNAAPNATKTHAIYSGAAVTTSVTFLCPTNKFNIGDTVSVYGAN